MKFLVYSHVFFRCRHYGLLSLKFLRQINIYYFGLCIFFSSWWFAFGPCCWTLMILLSKALNTFCIGVIKKMDVSGGYIYVFLVVIDSSSLGGHLHWKIWRNQGKIYCTSSCIQSTNQARCSQFCTSADVFQSSPALLC